MKSTRTRYGQRIHDGLLLSELSINFAESIFSKFTKFVLNHLNLDIKTWRLMISWLLVRTFLCSFCDRYSELLF